MIISCARRIDFAQDGRNGYGKTVASGVYFIRIKTEHGVKVARAVLLR
jgi:hypothetical protein